MDLPQHSDNVDEELHRVRLALTAVFSPSPQGTTALASDEWFQHRSLADRYLTSFQTTTVSWMVCDRLLQQEDSNQEQLDLTQQQQRRFFAAQTLHTKCRSDTHQLPVSSLPSLRDSLLAHLSRYATTGGTALTIRLALCVSALAVQMKWTNIVTDLLANPNANTNQTSQQQQLQQQHPVLLLLSVLPEECASDRLLLQDENLRFEMRDHLVSAAPSVFLFFESNMTSHASTVLQAFHTWIRYVPIHPNALVQSRLLHVSAQALQQQPPQYAQYLEEAADIVVETLRMYPSQASENHDLVRTMIPLLGQLPLQEALASNDEDVCRAYCRVMTEMGESYMSLLLSPQYQDAAKLVDCVLLCSAIPDSDIASITLNFWYRMMMDLAAIEPYDFRQELVDVYSSRMLRLIDVCVTGLMRYPADINEIPEDKVDDLHRHRFYVTETVEDCCRMLGEKAVIQRLGALLQQEVERIQGQTHQQESDWHGIESCLACIGAIHRFVPSDESVLLPHCFRLIPQLPQNIKPLRFTASKIIGKFASWLAMNPELLQPLMPYLSGGLLIGDCAPAAAVAIKELCECSNQNFAIAEPVMGLYEDISSKPGQLNLADELQILEGLCRALARQIQDTQSGGLDALSRLAIPIGTRLAAAVNDPTASARRVIPEIDRLTTIVQYLTIPIDLTSPNPVIELMSSTWTLLDIATSRFATDGMLAEKICRLHKHSMRSVGARAYAPVLDALIQQLVRSYDLTHHSPYLYAASACVVEYGHDPAYVQILFDMVAAMAKTSFSFLHSFHELTNHPDVVEELFYLMGRVISYSPDRLVVSPLLLSLFQCAVVGMQLDHHGANKGTIKFIENTISYGLKLREQNRPEAQQSLEHVFTLVGQSIVTNLARALMGDLPSYSSQIPEILWKLNLFNPGLLAQWLSTAFASAPLPERAKNDFMGALNTGLARDEFNLAARAFRSACERDRRFVHLRRT
jgi:transportin-3